MKKFLSFCVFFVFLAISLNSAFATTAESVPTGTKRWVERGCIVSADTKRLQDGCNNFVEAMYGDDNEQTYSRFIVNERVYLEFPWGGTVWPSGTTIEEVDRDVLKYHPGWTLDRKTTEWPRGSTPSGSTWYGSGGSSQQPVNDGDWPALQWKQLLVNQFLVVQSGTTYFNFTSQGQNTNSLNIIKPTTIVTTQAVWIWTTTTAKLCSYDPGYEKITLTPGSNTNPQQEEGWLYSNIPAHGYATGWLEAFINGSWVDMKQSCLNGLVVENNSNNQIQIRYKKADPNDPKDRRLVTVYSSGNSLESIKTHYANVLGVPVNHLSFRQIFLSPN